MTKRRMQAVGIEHDSESIRAVKMAVSVNQGETTWDIESTHTVEGDFLRTDSLVDGFKEIKHKLGIHTSTLVTSALSGKQVYVAQIPFQKLPAAEMVAALRFEIKKHVAYEVNDATIEFQPVGLDERSDMNEYLVSAVSNSFLLPYLESAQKAGIKPDCVVPLPVVLANGYWLINPSKSDTIEQVLIHVGKDMTVLVINGPDTPFYTRNILFKGSSLVNTPQADAEFQKSLIGMAGEITRSLRFYSSLYHRSEIEKIHIIGGVTHESAIPVLKEESHYDIDVTPLFPTLSMGEYDIACSAAIHGVHQQLGGTL